MKSGKQFISCARSTSPLQTRPVISAGDVSTRTAKLLIRLIVPIFAFLLLAEEVPGTAQELSDRLSVQSDPEKRHALEVVLIDSFFVPEVSKEAFVQRVTNSAQTLKTLPGFIEGFVYVKTSGESDVNIVTTAVWKDEAAFENAKKAVLAEFRKQGTDPAAIMKTLGVRASRSIYSRSPY
jgi:heme-degrading monooxygenase HmoA